MIPIRFIPLTWASRYADFKLFGFECFGSLQFYCGFLTLCTLYLYTTLLVIIYFLFFVASITGNIALFFFYIFLFGFSFLSTSWFPLFPILIWLRSVFLLWTKKVIFLKPKLGDFFTYAWFSLFYMFF